jgi:hypothetical protein
LILLGNGAWNFANTGFFVPVIFVSRTVAATTSGPWTGTLPRVDPDRMPSAWDVVHQADDRLHGRAHPSAPGWGIDLAGYARNAPRKLVETFSDTEHTHDYGYYGERSEVAALHMTPITFGALALLAVAGAGLLVRRAGWRRLAPLAPLFFGTIVTTTLYHPSTRYRLPLVLVLVVLAAVAVGAALRAHIRWRVGVAALLLAFAVRGFTHQLENPAWWELRVAEAAQAAGDADEVNRRVARARQLAPDDVELEQRIRGLTGHRPGT